MNESEQRRTGGKCTASTSLAIGFDAPSLHTMYLDKPMRGHRLMQAIVREFVVAVRSDVTIDWTVRENVRARLRVIVKRILRRYGYPRDKQEKATQTVLEQAEVLSHGW